MNDDPSSRKPNHRGWLERFSQVLLREPQDREQLINLLRDAEHRQLLDAEALRMIEGVLQISVMQVEDIMIPRSQMVVVEEDAAPETFLPLIMESGHSRFPVIGNNRDEVIGILLAKELLLYGFGKSNENIKLRDIVRPATFVPEAKRLNSLLTEFRLNHNHMAIVVDEYGGVSGLVTIEDILEQIVGQIEDEYDDDDEDEITLIKRQSETLYTVAALTPITAFNRHFNKEFSIEEFDTIGGLITQGFGHLPKPGETIELENLKFKILEADNRRVHLLQVDTHR